MDANRQRWAQQQQEVRRLLAHKRYADALHVWLRQHAMVHAAAMAQEGGWSFPDEVVEGLTDAQLRWQPSAGSNSIAWLLWHIARIEDVTMNLLVAGRPQVLDESSWSTRIGLTHRDVGTAMGDREVADVSARLDLAAVQAYRVAVGRRTRAIVSSLGPRDLERVVAPERIQALSAAEALADAASGLAETWGGWTTARFLLMPATRHSFTHLNQARRLRLKVKRQIN